MQNLAATQPAFDTRDRVPFALPRPISFALKTALALVLIQNIIGSILLLGWLTSATQRFVQNRWRRLGNPRSKAANAWPNFVLSPTSNTRLKKLFGNLFANLRIGVQTAFNTFVLTAPGCLLWFFSWYDGWNNSFNKGYEQAIVGPGLGILGVALFIAAMFYVPMAQTRQAATGDWRAFYQFRLVWKLIRRRFLSCLGLAIAISTLSLPVMVLKTAPNFFTAMSAEKNAPDENGFRRLLSNNNENLTPQQALGRLKTYYFFCGLYLLPALIIARYLAARIYAHAIVDAVQTGAIPEDALHESEWQTLHTQNLLTVRPAPKRNRFLQLLAWAATRAGRVTIGFATILVWFTLVAQIYGGEFLHKNDRGQGWWNQPLIQLPYFNYIPARLEKDAELP